MTITKAIQNSFLITSLGLAIFSGFAWAQPFGTIQSASGELADGTEFRIDYPSNFNGTLLIGLDYAGGQYNNAESQALLSAGYAMAGVTRRNTGWDVEAAIANQLRTLDIYEQNHGRAERTLAYGRSLGGHTGSAIIHYYGERFDGALLACGGLGGVVAMWNGKLDALFVAKTLLAPDNDELPIIDIPDDFAETSRPAWLSMLAEAQQTPEGKARIALAAVIAQQPVWAHADKEQAAPYDLDALQEGLYDSLAGSTLPTVGQAMSSRNELNRRSGGNFSFNTGVDYRAILENLENRNIVYELYRQAGLDIDADLSRLEQAPRISADPEALRWLSTQIWHGDLPVPVLTLNNIGDNISAMANQQLFESIVNKAGKGDLLRQVYVSSAGHCAFSPAETMTAINTLVERIDSGEWGQSTNPYTLNTAAEALDLGPARFIPYEPEVMRRPFDVCDLQEFGIEISAEAQALCSAE